MNKKIMLVTLLLLFIAIAFLIWKKLSDASTATGNVDRLSSRAQEFIQKEKGEGDTMWSTQQFASTSSVLGSSTRVENSCFSLTLPFATTNPSQEISSGRCTFKTKVVSPPAQLVISSYRSPEPSEDSGILLRQKNPDQYAEEQLSLPKYDQIYVFRGTDSVTAFAWKKQQMITISFNTSQPDTVKLEHFTRLFESVTLSSDTMKAK